MDASKRPDTYTADDIIGMAKSCETPKASAGERKLANEKMVEEYLAANALKLTPLQLSRARELLADEASRDHYPPNEERMRARIESIMMEAKNPDGRDPMDVVLSKAIALIKRADKANEQRRTAGILFKELKERVLAGEAEEKTWGEYVAKHITPRYNLAPRTVALYITFAEGGVKSFDRAMEDADKEADAGLASDMAATKARADAKPTSSASGQWVNDDDPSLAPALALYRRWLAEKGLTDNRANWRKWESEEEWKHSDAKGNAAAKAQRDQAKLDKERERGRQRRAKEAEQRVAAGGEAPKTRNVRDRETTEQYQKLASLAKVLDAGQLQIINEIIEERWPGTWEKAEKAKAERDTAQAKG